MNEIERKTIIEHVKKNSERLKYDEDIFNILEGDVSSYLKQEFKVQLSEPASTEAMERSCPINILRKIIEKLSKIYSNGVIRTTENPSDQEIVDSYMVNDYFAEANSQFNAYKRCGIEIYHNEEEQKVDFRVIPPQLYLPYSDSVTNPLRMTKFIKLFDNKLVIYSDETLTVIDPKTGDMLPNPTEGVNEFGIIPFSYLTRSKYLLLPIPDTDTKQMSILFPLLLSDLNFAVKYLTNPIIYGVNVDCANLKRNPNVFWSFTTIEEGKTPSIGSITPDADLKGIMENIKEQMSFWLETKNIKSDTIGISSGDVNSSGLALMIRNIDTTEDRNQQIVYFKRMEQDFWHRLAKIHNYLASIGAISDRRQFSDDFKINVVFPSQKPLEDRSQAISRLIQEVNNGLVPRRAAIKELNPDLNDDQIEVILKEIEDDLIVVRTTPEGTNGETAEDSN
jgi:hypothetical protein